jgi:hypothetical protein
MTQPCRQQAGDFRCHYFRLSWLAGSFEEVRPQSCRNCASALYAEAIHVAPKIFAGKSRGPVY